jgi:putative ABC transport system ATP-binding protein
MTPVLRLTHLRKEYPGSVVALGDVSLTIEAGDDLAIVGPSGSGKSTLLNLMGTLDRPTSGRMDIAGQDTALLTDEELSRLRAENIGFVFQQSYLFDRLTAQANVAAGLQYTGVPRRRWRGLALEALHRVGLDHRIDHLPGQLSGGERQRVGIARALVNGPAVILADEPTGALDQTNGLRMLELIRNLHAEGATIVLITHDLAVAATFTRKIEIRDGRLTHAAGALA